MKKESVILVIAAVGVGLYLMYKGGYLSKIAPAKVPTTTTATVQKPTNTIPTAWASGYANLQGRLGSIAPVFEDKTYRMSETRSGIITAQEQPIIAPKTVISPTTFLLPQQGAVMGQGQPVSVTSPEPIAYTPVTDLFRKRPLTISPPPAGG